MARMSTGVPLGLVAALLVSAGGVSAQPVVDQPINALRLLLRATPRGAERLVLVSGDKSVSLTPPDAADPATLELFSHATGEHAVLAFDGADATWIARSRGRRGPIVRYRDPNPSAASGGIKRLVHRVGRHLVVVGTKIGLSPTAAHEGVGVRLTVGSTRLCALFDAPTVRRDRPGLFSAQGARAASLADCSDAALAGPLATTTSTTSTTTTTTSTTSTTMVVGVTVGNDQEFPDASDHSPDFLVGTRVDVPVDSMLTHFGVIGKMSGPGVRLGLYRDVGGEPTTLMAGTSPSVLANGRMEIPVSPVALAAGSYWLMAVYDGSASVGIDETDPEVQAKYAFAPYPEGLPAALNGAQSFFGQQYNYYVRIAP